MRSDGKPRLTEMTADELKAYYAPIVSKRIAKLRVTHPHMFRPTNTDLFWQRHAMKLVREAVKRGILPALRGAGIACFDCGKAADLYEHRDYSRPLDVQPVCYSCNLLRGTAIWPAADQFNFPRVKGDS